MSKKKKSKIAKKIQATKKFAGIAVSSRTQSKHGGKNMGGPNIMVGITQATSNVSLPNSGIRSTVLSGMNSKQKQGPKNFGTKQFQKQQKQQQQRQPNNRKDDDFRSQMKSFQERAERNEEQIQQRNQRQQRNMPLQMAPATFVIDDKLKSTQRLVQEATQKMEMTQFVLGNTATMPTSDFGMTTSFTTTGAAATTTNTTSSSHERQQWLAASSLSSTIQSNPPPQQRSHRWTEHDTSLHHDDNDNDNNPYAILQDDDDDNDDDDNHHTKGTEHHHRRTQQPLPLLQFAPPSFQVLADTTRHPSSNPFFDPDL